MFSVSAMLSSLLTLLFVSSVRVFVSFEFFEADEFLTSSSCSG